MGTAVGARILLVDDEEAFRKSTQQNLEMLGYECIAAPDVERACKLFESQTFDVVVSDIRMKGDSGLEFVKRLSASRRAPPVILVTGYPSIDTAVEALDLRLVGYLVKPFEISELSTRIEEALTLQAQRASVEKLRDSLNDMQVYLEGISEPITSPSLRPEPLTYPDDVESARRRCAAEWDTSDAGLTSRERQLVTHLLEGYRVSTIAEKLSISPHTVRRHLKSIFLKLEVNSQAELLEKMKPWNP